MVHIAEFHLEQIRLHLEGSLARIFHELASLFMTNRMLTFNYHSVLNFPLCHIKGSKQHACSMFFDKSA